VNDDNQENRPRMRYFRYAVFSLTALLVLSLGFALIAPEPPAPAEPPFSEQARAAALEESLRLRSAGLDLAAAGGNAAAGGMPANLLDGVVTLLTIQSRALLPAELLAAGPASAEASAAASVAASARTSLPAGATSSAAPPSPGPPGHMTVAEFAAALAASGQQRLKDAETADGGMARLLAGSGIAQLLAAERLGARGTAQTGTAHTGTAQDSTEQDSPSVSSGASSRPGASACPPTPNADLDPDPAPGPGADADTSVGAALAAAAEAELETVYGYQAALTRLPPDGVGPASDFLEQHQNLAAQAETFSLAHCRAPALQPPGYALNQAFLDAPVPGLARLEADTLPAYGDLVAVAGGTTRAWALSALQGAARRAQHWGAAASPAPGLVLDEAKLPQLPG
jgi:hypothetical protein